MARSRRDGGPIAARSWLDRSMIVIHFRPKLRLTYLKFGSYDAAPENRAHDSEKTLPRPPLSPMNLGQFPSLKACISLLCSSTFDRFVKELSKFRGRSLVHRDPPADRLNSEGIGAGFITNFSLISSNFPLELRKSVRNDPSKFTPIRANWSLILVAIGLVVRFD